MEEFVFVGEMNFVLKLKIFSVIEFIHKDDGVAGYPHKEGILVGTYRTYLVGLFLIVLEFQPVEIEVDIYYLL